MTEDIKLQLLEWADTYHCTDFIENDPVQFPHRYTRKQDIEISGLLTAIMSFGNRKQILKKADELHVRMGDSPYQYVLSRKWEKDFPVADKSSFYRMLSYSDFNGYFRRLNEAYSSFDSLEDALLVHPGSVDLGIWRSYSRRDLIIPLDTHVCRVAYALHLTETETFSLKNARRITDALAEVFPDDPCLGDFALFGYGVNNK